jgi:glycerol dehydrogenase-like iron-containing ADH family enzyme
MSLPPSFSGMPIEEQHHYYRNVCIDLKKAIKTTKDCEVLREKMERFISASREVAWPTSASDVYHRDRAEKAIQKVANEFRRYLHDLENSKKDTNPEDFLNALALVEAMVDTLKVR